MKKNRDILPGLSEPYMVDHLSLSRTGQKIPQGFIPGEPMSQPVHAMTFILIIYGEATIQINGKEYALQKDFLVSIAPFHSYGFISTSVDLIYEYIIFRIDLMSDFPLLLKPYISEKIEECPCLKLSEEELDLLIEYQSRITKQYKRREHPSRVEIIKALLFVFIAEVSYIYSRQPIPISNKYQEQIADGFFCLLRLFYKKERKPEFYARKLGLTTKHLSKVLKSVTGNTLYTWICEFVIKEAKIMLQSSRLTITQIAHELNFPTSTYFARYFRKYTGMSPMDYRKLPKNSI